MSFCKQFSYSRNLCTHGFQSFDVKPDGKNTVITWIHGAGCPDGGICGVIAKKDQQTDGWEVVVKDRNSSKDVSQWLGKVNIIFSAHGNESPMIEMVAKILFECENAQLVQAIGGTLSHGMPQFVHARWYDIGPKPGDKEYIPMLETVEVIDHHQRSLKNTRTLLQDMPPDKCAINFNRDCCAAVLMAAMVEEKRGQQLCDRPWVEKLINFADLWDTEEAMWDPIVRKTLTCDLLRSSSTLPGMMTSNGESDEDYTLILKVLYGCRAYMPSLTAAQTFWDDLTGGDERLGKLIDSWVSQFQIACPTSIKFVEKELACPLVDLQEGRVYFASCWNKKDSHDANGTGGDLWYQLSANKKKVCGLPIILITADSMAVDGLLQIGVRRIPNYDDLVDAGDVAEMAARMFPKVVKSGGGHEFAAAFQVPGGTTLDVTRDIAKHVGVAYLMSKVPSQMS